MSGYFVTLIVVFVLVFVGLVFFIVNLSFIGIFSRKLKEHGKALTILLTQKYENFESLFEIYNKNSIRVKKSIQELFKSIDVKNFEKMDTEESCVDRSNLSLLKQELTSIVKNNKDFQKNEEFQMAIKMMNSIDEQFRTVAAAYNADVIGYNYWIRFKPFKYLFLFNHVAKKEIIS